jgi:hypothetical protein
MALWTKGDANMSGVELIFLLSASLLAFWVVGKVVGAALRFLFFAALGVVVVGILFLGYLVVCYGGVLAVFAAWLILRRRPQPIEDDWTTEGEGGQ